jgi:very-short-patch-repair endonuclease
MPHKRTTPKIFYRAKELRHEMTPAEAKLWAYLRAKTIGRTRMRPPVGARYIVPLPLLFLRRFFQHGC